MKNNNLWGGRFSQQMNDLTADFGESISFDQKLYHHSVTGSIAHAEMLAKQGIISKEDAEKIIEGLKVIEGRIERNEIEFDIHDEDIMMTIEKNLIAEIGDAGKKLHTARSRNDQSVSDTTLFLREAVRETLRCIAYLLSVTLEKAKEQKDVIMPGFTHLQHAQPVTVGYYFMSHFQGLRRDAERFLETYGRINVNPLGACAFAGTTLPTDRFYTTRLLGYSAPSENAADSVGSRDNIAEYLFNAALCMTHLSGFAEEIVVFATQEFNYISIEDSYCTGSSIMPQKKNPDIAELVRGKVGRCIGNLMTLLTIMKGTFLTYNRDYQEDKEPLFDSIQTLDRSLKIFGAMLQHLTFNEDVLREQVKKGFLEATDIAEYLVMQGVPFRDAHGMVGSLVRYCEENGKYFSDITGDELKKLGITHGLNDLSRFSVENCINNRNSFGATSGTEVARQISVAEEFLEELEGKIAAL